MTMLVNLAVCRSMLVNADLHEKAHNHAEKWGVRTNVGHVGHYIDIPAKHDQHDQHCRNGPKKPVTMRKNM